MATHATRYLSVRQAEIGAEEVERVAGLLPDGFLISEPAELTIVDSGGHELTFPEGHVEPGDIFPLSLQRIISSTTDTVYLLYGVI